MKTTLLVGAGLVLVFTALLLGLAIKSKPASPPMVVPTPTGSATTQPADRTGLNLQLPSGFSIKYLATKLDTPRDLLWVENALLVSLPPKGQVVAIHNDQIIVLAEKLNYPHGLAYANGYLYIAETNKVTRYSYDPAKQLLSAPKKLFDLPNGGLHKSRSLHIQGTQLFTSIGSDCNACNESDLHRAAILVSDLEGNGLRVYASGLRNSVFMTTSPSGKLLATDNGRDLLGDDLPPDEINHIEDGKDYGWPYCYGQNIRDEKFDSAKYTAAPGQNICDKLGKTGSYIDLQAHSAPLGLAFTPATWPEPYKNALLVAFHGSWNRSTPTGYKIIVAPTDLYGKPGIVEDFVSGWLTDKQQVIGRPVDLEFDPSGNLYISDDKSGSIFVVSPPRK